MDSLDYVEAIFCLEEVFEVEVPEKYSEGFESHREIVDWLELSLSNASPNERAKAFLRRLAIAQHRPELIEELNGKKFSRPKCQPRKAIDRSPYLFCRGIDSRFTSTFDLRLPTESITPIADENHRLLNRNHRHSTMQGLVFGRALFFLTSFWS